ncbi:hypothetical protein [Rhodococcoides fascians]|uniref:hypothetical protein n=1 Tax=Rhodococcoides fascians TaxID=1828 RepID=UPI00050CAB02|nr:hypothetical protein [Rhodococcus fascians]
MTAGVVGVLAEALAQHEFAPQKGADHVGCFGCDWVSYGIFPRSEHAEHVASVVAALPNIAIVPRTQATGDLAHVLDKTVDALYSAWEAMSTARDTINDHLIGDDVASNALGEKLLRDLDARAAGGQA